MEFQMMERDRIQPSPLNPRKQFDEADLRELADSMGNDVGLIEPLVVRMRPDLNCYELVAGERRWRAAGLAGLVKVPVIVKKLTDPQVALLMLIENGQRRDVNPIEEGEGFKQALALGAVKDVDELAAQVGKSRRYVYDHLKMVDDLVPAAKELLLKGEISGSHGVILSRLTPAQQEQACNPDEDGLFEFDNTVADGDADIDPVRVRSVRSFEGVIAQRFKLEPSSRAMRELFPETAAAVAMAAKVVQISHAYYLHDEHVLPSGRWRRADGQEGSQSCDHRVLGVVVLGDGRGQAFDVCTDTKCAVHWESARITRGGVDRVAKSESQKQLELRQRKERENERAETDAWKKSADVVLGAIAVRLKSSTPDALAKFLSNDGAGYKTAIRLVPGNGADVVLRRLVVAMYASRYETQNYHYGRTDFMRSAMSDLKVDVAGVLKKVQTSAPKKVEAKKKPAQKKPKALAGGKKGKKVAP